MTVVFIKRGNLDAETDTHGRRTLRRDGGEYHVTRKEDIGITLHKPRSTRACQQLEEARKSPCPTGVRGSMALPVP